PCSSQKSTTPALMNSSRSTRGTTRTTAYSNARRVLTAGLLERLLQQVWKRLHAGAEPGRVGGPLARHVLEAAVVLQPGVRDGAHHLVDDLPAEGRAQVTGRLV